MDFFKFYFLLEKIESKCFLFNVFIKFVKIWLNQFLYVPERFWWWGDQVRFRCTRAAQNHHRTLTQTQNYHITLVQLSPEPSQNQAFRLAADNVLDAGFHLWSFSPTKFWSPDPSDPGFRFVMVRPISTQGIWCHLRTGSASGFSAQWDLERPRSCFINSNQKVLEPQPVVSFLQTQPTLTLRRGGRRSDVRASSAQSSFINSLNVKFNQ